MSLLDKRLTFKTLVVGPMFANCYIIGDKKTRSAFIIDSGGDGSLIKKYLNDNGLKALFIIHTHGHIDHIGADNEFDIPIYIHELDKGCLSDANMNLSGFVGDAFITENKKINTLKDGDMLKFEDSTLEIIHTPGHTPGGISIRLDNAVFTGDTLFACGIGRTDFEGGSLDILLNSINKRLLNMGDDIVIYPGHGEPSTIGKEKTENPFLSGV